MDGERKRAGCAGTRHVFIANMLSGRVQLLRVAMEMETQKESKELTNSQKAREGENIRAFVSFPRP